MLIYSYILEESIKMTVGKNKLNMAGEQERAPGNHKQKTRTITNHNQLLMCILHSKDSTVNLCSS